MKEDALSGTTRGGIGAMPTAAKGEGMIDLLLLAITCTLLLAAGLTVRRVAKA